LTKHTQNEKNEKNERTSGGVQTLHMKSHTIDDVLWLRSISCTYEYVVGSPACQTRPSRRRFNSLHSDGSLVLLSSCCVFVRTVGDTTGDIA